MEDNTQIISDLNNAIKSGRRRDKIEAIYGYCSDELESISDWVDIAAEELDELDERLQNIINYYQDQN